ncbi:hypothetical protein E4T50_05107 [Aureobasidium sp. EXF-12298]|nr:hypothetical protein E4T50_05107 [Aureobasidium sp. EXF-12298]
MGTRPDPQSHTWTAEALSTILQTPTKRITCKCSDDSTILIPEFLLCYFSRYYNALLHGNFLEAGSNNITLELNGSQARAFVTWMYSGQFAESLQYPMLFDLQIRCAGNEKSIMTFIHQRSHRRKSPLLEDAVKAFSVLPKSCGLVRWTLDRFALHEGFTQDTDPEFAVGVIAARNMVHVFQCRNTTMSRFADPCCNVIKPLGCNCECCSGRQERAKKGQACAYHEHASVEEWANCTGDDFKASVDLAYLKGMTVNDPVPEARFARHYGRLGWEYGRLQ